jgi:hypothetical protein
VERRRREQLEGGNEDREAEAAHDEEARREQAVVQRATIVHRYVKIQE